MTSRLVVIGLILGLAVGCGGASTPAGDERDAGRLRIAVIPKGTTHEFWKSVHAGAVRAERELDGVEIIYRGPEREDDRDQQVALVQNFVSSGVDAIVLAPLDVQALLQPVRLATQSGIPVVVIDSGLAGEVGRDYVSYIATDNIEGGRIAGRRMGELLGGQGRALLLRHQEGSESTMNRERGFIEALQEFPGVELIDPHRYSGATRATAQAAAEGLLMTQAEVDGIFCANESSTFGMLLALRSRGLAGSIRFIGFDSSPGLVEALEAGELDGLVLQNPMSMGYLGVRTAVAHLRGEPIETHHDTGVTLVTRDNMSQPELQQLLSPDLSSLLEP